MIAFWVEFEVCIVYKSLDILFSFSFLVMIAYAKTFGKSEGKKHLTVESLVLSSSHHNGICVLIQKLLYHTGILR